VTMARLFAIFLVFAPLSLVSFGGGPSIFAEMQRQTVNVHHWITDRDFVDLFAISRAAPGPGTLISALIGWRAAGVPGAATAALSLYLPSGLLFCAASLVFNRARDSAWRTTIERALVPVAVGLIFAGALSLFRAADGGGLQALTVLAATAILLRPNVSPYWVMGGVALIYAALAAVGI
jgi:chromate transporter